jgi:hypothetical protein
LHLRHCILEFPQGCIETDEAIARYAHCLSATHASELPIATQPHDCLMRVLAAKGALNFYLNGFWDAYHILGVGSFTHPYRFFRLFPSSSNR